MNAERPPDEEFRKAWRALPQAESFTRKKRALETTGLITETKFEDPAPVIFRGPTQAERLRNQILKRGHGASFCGLFVFTFILYFRPYELFPSLSWLYSGAFWSAVATLAIFIPTHLALEGNLTVRPKEINLLLLLVIATLLSMPLALSFADAWAEFTKMFIKAILMFIVMVNVVRSERRLRALLWLALAVSCYLSLNAISDFRAGRLLDMGTRVAGVIGGMFGNPNDMALHLVTMAPVAVAFFFTRRNPLAKIVYAMCALLLVGGIVVSFSRGGFLGLLAAGGVLAWKLGRRHRLAVVLCVALAFVAFGALAPSEYRNRLGTIANIGGDATGSAGARQALLVRSILVTARHPLLGIGMGNFHILSIGEAVSHNAYTQVSAEMGIYALLIYLWFMVTPLRGLRRIERETFAARRASRFYYFAVGLQAALVGYMVSSFFASVAYNFYVYYLVGYAVCLRRLYDTACAEEAEAAHAAAPADEGAPRNAEIAREPPPAYSEHYA
ncbi:MAG: O-antigen ligase family protein [Chloroflexota bacterium]